MRTIFIAFAIIALIQLSVADPPDWGEPGYKAYQKWLKQQATGTNTIG